MKPRSIFLEGNFSSVEVSLVFNILSNRHRIFFPVAVSSFE